MGSKFRNITVLMALVLIIATTWLASAGPLTPPAGTISPTGRFGPRTDVATLAGSASAVHRIEVSGSYYLSGNITGAAAKNGIDISAGGVTLDLNGFTLIGVVGSLDGISMGGNHVNVVITNGHVDSWGGRGIDARINNGRIERVTAANNGDWGIINGSGGGSHGVHIVSCEAWNNGALILSGGINSGDYAIISDCIARDNTGVGIRADFGCTVSACVVTSNTEDGIFAQSASIISACTSQFNSENGIEVVTDSFVTGNICDRNGVVDGAGVHVTGVGNRIERNNVTNNDRGIDVDATGNLIILNSSHLNTSHYSIVAGNDVGPIQNAATSTSPWANIAF